MAVESGEQFETCMDQRLHWQQDIREMKLPSIEANMKDPTTRQRLRTLLGSAVRFDEPMAGYTSFGIGGPADAMAAPKTPAQLRQLVAWASHEHIPYMVIGQGTNLLVKDGGIRGLVIRLNRLASDTRWAEKGTQIRVKTGLGLPTRTICSLALRQGWQGMNFALGIPGCLGGAVAMNAGTHLGCMADVIASITVLTAQAQWVTLDNSVLHWTYRRCDLPAHLSPEAILVEGELRLTQGEIDRLRDEARRVMKQRVAHQPIGMACAGSFFKNPKPDMTAGRLIDEAGLKGLTVGRARVSPLHANFIVNLGGATAEDVLRLKDQIQTSIWQQFTVELIPEVHIVGEAVSS